METKRQFREQILHLEHRIEDLEERLCPCGSHQWKLIQEHYIYNWYDVDTIYTYKCARCGKEIETYFPKEITA